MKYLVLTIFLSLSSLASASPLLKISSKNISAQQKVQLQSFIEDIESHIPETLRNSFSKQIKIEFVTYKENGELPFNRCEKKAVDFKYGSVNFFNRHKIKLSIKLLPQILESNREEEDFPCGHHSFYKQAVATVLHELSHLYDSKRIHDQGVSTTYQECKEQYDDDNDIPDSRCRKIIHEYEFGNTVSGSQAFFRLANWKQGLLKSKAKNLGMRRSPNVYEYHNIKEHFAVNFEHFLLDPEYKCRRPSYYKFYSKHFDFNPYSEMDCSPFTRIQLDDKNAMVNLDPKRVYRIDYLLASKGKGMAAGFGHSMYRVVLCAPYRKKVDEQCLKDKLHHVVLSYRANITDLKTNMLKGVFGGYDSILFMLSFPKVLVEYNLGELRDLISVPLKLSQEQKADFINKVLETYWEYSGNYKFVSQNCATESHELLQSALNDQDLRYGEVFTPYGLKDELERVGLIDRDILKSRSNAIKNGYIFESDKEKLSKIKEELFGEQESDYITYKRRVGSSRPGSRAEYETVREKREVLDILKDFKFDTLQSKFDDLMAEKSQHEKLKSLAIFVNALITIKQKEMDETIGGFLEKQEEQKTELGKLINTWNDLRSKNRVVSHDQSYGIPLTLEAEELKEVKDRFQHRDELELELVDRVKSEYQESIDELLELTNLLKNTRFEARKAEIEFYSQKK